jgi:hypothetical protein
MSFRPVCSKREVRIYDRHDGMVKIKQIEENRQAVEWEGEVINPDGRTNGHT